MSISAFAQNLESIKHIEIVSEVQDSMALLNKTDIDIINSTFEEKRRLDTLSYIRKIRIDSLVQVNNNLEEIVAKQKAIISNSSKVEYKLKCERSYYKDLYIKEKKKRQNSNIGVATTTGISAICILLLVLL